jgi:hypothetical protein
MRWRLISGVLGWDQVNGIGTTLCLPTLGRSAMKSAAGEEEQHGSPFPHGRRMSVMSPAAIPMNVEEGDDKLKRGSGQGDRQDPRRGTTQYQPPRAGPACPAPDSCQPAEESEDDVSEGRDARGGGEPRG